MGRPVNGQKLAGGDVGTAGHLVAGASLVAENPAGNKIAGGTEARFPIRYALIVMRSALLLLSSSLLAAQGRFQPGIKPFLAVDTPAVALTHVRVIDGTGAAPRDDQAVVIAGGKISAATTPPA